MESSGRTLVCSVLFLDIVEYSKKPVSDQLQLKQEFNRVLTKSLEQVPARDRIILDTGDGAAVTFMGDPEDALFASMAMRDSRRSAGGHELQPCDVYSSITTGALPVGAALRGVGSAAAEHAASARANASDRETACMECLRGGVQEVTAGRPARRLP